MMTSMTIHPLAIGKQQSPRMARAVSRALSSAARNKAHSSVHHTTARPTKCAKASRARRKWLCHGDLFQNPAAARGTQARELTRCDMDLGLRTMGTWLLPPLLFLLPLLRAFLRTLAVAGADLVLLQHL